MSYCDLIRQEGEYTYSVNIQFDIENDTKLLRFVPNDTTIKLLKDYFTDLVRTKSYNHARILYGSYGTGKSHLLTVLSQIVGKSHVDGVAYRTFIERIRNLDSSLANDIDSFINALFSNPDLLYSNANIAAIIDKVVKSTEFPTVDDYILVARDQVVPSISRKKLERFEKEKSILQNQ